MRRVRKETVSWAIHLGIFPWGKTGELGMKTVEEEEAGGWIMLKFSTRCGRSTYCELGDTGPALGGMAAFFCAHDRHVVH